MRRRPRVVEHEQHRRRAGGLLERLEGHSFVGLGGLGSGRPTSWMCSVCCSAGTSGSWPTLTQVILSKA